MSSTALGLLFLVGMVASGAAAYLRSGTLLGTVAKATTVSFALLTVFAFLL